MWALDHTSRLHTRIFQWEILYFGPLLGCDNIQPLKNEKLIPWAELFTKSALYIYNNIFFIRVLRIKFSCGRFSDCMEPAGMTLHNLGFGKAGLSLINTKLVASLLSQFKKIEISTPRRAPMSENTENPYLNTKNILKQ